MVWLSSPCVFSGPVESKIGYFDAHVYFFDIDEEVSLILQFTLFSTKAAKLIHPAILSDAYACIFNPAAAVQCFRGRPPTLQIDALADSHIYIYAKHMKQPSR